MHAANKLNGSSGPNSFLGSASSGAVSMNHSNHRERQDLHS